VTNLSLPLNLHLKPFPPIGMVILKSGNLAVITPKEKGCKNSPF
jgi:hypothetical protein